MARKSSFPVYIAALIFFVGGIGYLAWAGFSEHSVYHLHVSEALAMPSEQVQAARLFGVVDADGISRPADGLGVRFLLLDAEKPDQTLWVDYKGVVPDTFKAGSEVIIEGRLADGEFNAVTLMTKCPSKHEKKKREHSQPTGSV